MDNITFTYLLQMDNVVVNFFILSFISFKLGFEFFQYNSSPSVAEQKNKIGLAAK